MVDARRTIAIILGVSECPQATTFSSLVQCANSANAFDGYLRASMHIPNTNILNLFNSRKSASDQLEQIEKFLVSRRDAGEISDVIFYYSGHGAFTRSDQAYFLAVYKTRNGAEGASSIRFVDLSGIIKRCVETARKYFILDCCFAGAAVPRMQTTIDQLVARDVEPVCESGTAVLCSSAAKLASTAPEGERYTMFSGAVLRCLREGIPDGPKMMSLDDVCTSARRYIFRTYPDNAVRPELHAPEQVRGNPAYMPLFPNSAWQERIEAAPRAVEVGPRTIAVRAKQPVVEANPPKMVVLVAIIAAAIFGVTIHELVVDRDRAFLSEDIRLLPIKLRDFLLSPIELSSAKAETKNEFPSGSSYRADLTFAATKRVSGDLVCRMSLKNGSELGASFPDWNEAVPSYSDARYSKYLKFGRSDVPRGRTDHENFSETVENVLYSFYVRKDALPAKAQVRLECYGNRNSPIVEVEVPLPR